MQHEPRAEDTLNAFVDLPPIDLVRRPDGPLAGLTFALKDLFDLAGVPTGAGSPDWRATHPAPSANAAVLDILLEAGARLVGKTHTDEIAWSLNGENHHYGTPENPAAPGRIPGGSSSGSAAATAGGLVDFAIGSDTGGSVRLPASYCGLYGLRPTHGRISIAGAVPLAPSYDCVGWFARDPATFARVGAVLLGAGTGAARPKRLLVADDLFAAAGAAVVGALAAARARIETFYTAADHVVVAPEGLDAWRNAFRVAQSAEAWATHRDWIETAKPNFGPGVRERFAAAARLERPEIEAALARRADIRRRMDDLLGDDALLLLPTAPGIAPVRGTDGEELEAFRARALALLCPAGHAGLPQISLPLARLEGCPIGLSVIAPRGRDEWLLALAQRV